MMFSVETTIMFVSYSALMIFIGFYFYKKNKNVEDYFLGGRSMGPVVSALSAGASDMSGWLLMGLPGALYVAGYIEAYIAVGLIAGATLNWLFVAKRLRVYTSVIANSITIPDYFETRFDDDKHILRIVCAIIILIFFTLYVSSGLVGGAKLFESTFGIQYDYALAVGVLIIVAYTFLGGYKAVCWTDMIQGFLMLVALIVVPFVMLSKIGGFDQVAKYINQSDDSSLQIIQIQTKIPSVIQNIESSQSQEIVAVLIHLLENSNDRVLGEKNIQKEYQKDSVVLNIFGGDLKSSIFPKEIALKIKMALEQKDY